MRILGGIVVVLGILFVVVWGAGRGWFAATWHGEEAQGRAISSQVLEERRDAIRNTAEDLGANPGKQILFGDLHVHTTFSFDAFQMSLPMAGGDGAYPVADACDYARHCAGLDFWSINDHGITLTPRRWSETVESMRQCNEIAGDTSSPDLVSFLGWEWTQVGTRPENHWGHKNVVLLDLEDGEIPTRPITAGTPEGMDREALFSPTAVLGLGVLSLIQPSDGAPAFARYMAETNDVPDCASGVPVRELPDDCREIAPTPAELFAKLDDWNHNAMVIPHGTAWGFYTPLGSSWEKQLVGPQHDPNRQRIVEVYSGHGNSEEYRPWRGVILGPDGSRSCPEPSKDYLPSCWRAGELIEQRCLAAELSAEECTKRAATARQHFVDAEFNGGTKVVPGATAEEWQDAGQCRDCFQPDFNLRPRSTVQYMMALGEPQADKEPRHFRFGFIAASDNHSARPGTGYKEVARTEFTETRFGNFLDTPIGEVPQEEPVAVSSPVTLEAGAAPFSLFETERQASYFLTGGLAGVHADGRDRQSVWDAIQRREVYGTSGPRILLWFDLLNPPEGQKAVPMGSEVAMTENPRFRVRAAGSFKQKPGCPPDAMKALPEERIERLCRGECYNPSDERREITRVEVVRIWPQENGSEDVTNRIEDPWKVLQCTPSPTGCVVLFEDPDFAENGEDFLYYVRAVEEATPTIAANPLNCTRDASGSCISIDPCFGRPDDDECLSESEQRAWSSPIFIDHANL